MKYNNMYRLTKTGYGLTLQERIERLESQMQDIDTRLNIREKKIEKQKQMLINFSREMKEEIKDTKFIADFMNSSTNSKLGDKIDEIEDCTESAVNKLTRKAATMNRLIERVFMWRKDGSR